VFDGTVAVYEVEAQALSEPVAILVHWLAKGRPRIMAVRELWTATPKLVCDSCKGPVRVATGLHGGGYRHDNSEPNARAEFCETPDGYVRVKVDGRQSAVTS
jgi:acetoacetate decarboxylase